MKSISKILAGLVLLGLFAVGIFFDEMGIVADSFKINHNPQETTEHTNKITVAEMTNERVFRLDKSSSDVKLNTFISNSHNDLVFDHLLTAREFSGAMVFAGNEPAGLELSVKAPVNLPNADLPESISAHEAPHQNQAADFSDNPTMQLTATSLRKIKGNRYALQGMFSLHGVSRPVQIPVSMKATNDRIHMQGELSFLQSDYSIASYNSASHTTLNKDKVVLKFNLSASAK